MKNGEILRLLDNNGNLADSRLLKGLTVVGHLKGVKFSYGIAKNKKLVESEIENLQKSIEQSTEFKEFENKRTELCEEYAEKDEKGTFKTINNEYVIPEDKKEEFNIRLDAYREQHKEAIEDRAKQVVAFKEIEKEESTVEFYKIKLSDVPEDISAEEMQGINELITEE